MIKTDTINGATHPHFFSVLPYSSGCNLSDRRTAIKLIIGVSQIPKNSDHPKPICRFAPALAIMNDRTKEQTMPNNTINSIYFSFAPNTTLIGINKKEAGCSPLLVRYRQTPAHE